LFSGSSGYAAVLTGALAMVSVSAMANASDGNTYKGQCHNKLAWFANAETDGASAVLLPCGEEEPAAVIALYCKRADRSVEISVEAGRGQYSEQNTYPAVVAVDGRGFKYFASYNPLGMYDTFNFTTGYDDPVLEALQAGSSAGIAIQGNATEFSLKGSRAAIGFMLARCLR
jgi:hypothetical protein